MSGDILSGDRRISRTDLRIEFSDDLPREETGRIYKRRLRDPYWAGRETRI